MPKPTLAKLSEKAATALQLLVRLEAADDNGYVSCVTCGTTRHYKDGMQGGHFIGRKWTATRLMKENVHPQCMGCNGPKKGAPIEYTLYMQDMYGKEFVEELLVLKHQTKKWVRGELEDLIKHFKERIKEEEKRVIG